MSTFGDGLYQYGGVPVASANLGYGKSFFVRPSTGSDSNKGSTPSQAFKTLSRALEACVSGRGDTVYLIAQGNSSASTTDYQSETLDWSKDLTHLIGVSDSPFIGSRARIGQLSSVLTIDTLFKVSGSGCLIDGISIFQGVAGSTATAPIALEITGERNKISNCQISGIGHADMDVAGGRSLKITAGSENTIVGCFIGLDTIIRATSTTECELSGAATRNIFRDCMFEMYTSSSARLMFSIAAAMDRFTLFDSCIFNNVQNISSATAATAVFNAASWNGNILLRSPFANGFTNYTAADNSRLVALGFDGTASGHLIGISQGIDVA